MKNLLKMTLSTALVFVALIAVSQPPGGGRRGGGPDEMIKREKQAVYAKITDLSEDQKLLLDGIYDEFEVTLKEKFEEIRNSGNREGMREKMQALRKEKDDLVKDVLNEDQFALYQEVSAPRRGRRQGANPNGDGE
ncbi:MAG: hypothetical protein ABJG47_09520 [Ekhidna sp.]